MDVTDPQKGMKELIIDAAREVFARYGYAKTTMNDIARAIGKGKSSIYHYFTGKDEIFRLVVEGEVNKIKDEITGALAKEDNPRGKLRAYVLTRNRLLNQLAIEYINFKDEYIESYGFIEELRKEYDEYEVAIIKDILRDGIERDLLSVRDLDTTSFTIVAALKSLEYHWAMEKDLSKIEKNTEVLLDVLFYGIAKE